MDGGEEGVENEIRSSGVGVKGERSCAAFISTDFGCDEGATEMR